MDPASELRRADALHLDRQYPEAIEAYRRALAGDASLHAAWYGLGCASLSLKAYGDAVDALRHAVGLRPDADGARCNLAEALFQLGEVDAAIAEYQRAADSGNAEVRAIALAGIACIAPGASHQDNFNVMAARRRWIDWEARGLRRVKAAAHEAGRKLRVGYLERVLRRAQLDETVYGRHQRPRSRPFRGSPPLRRRRAVRGLRLHRPCGGPHLGDRRRAERRTWRSTSSRRGLDVLVDLNGYSFQRRLPVFLYRPARLQICWHGMYGTTGLREIDWLVGDAAVIPPEEER